MAVHATQPPNHNVMATKAYNMDRDSFRRQSSVAVLPLIDSSPKYHQQQFIQLPLGRPLTVIASKRWPWCWPRISSKCTILRKQTRAFPIAQHRAYWCHFLNCDWASTWGTLAALPTPCQCVGLTHARSPKASHHAGAAFHRTLSGTLYSFTYYNSLIC